MQSRGVVPPAGCKEDNQGQRATQSSPFRGLELDLVTTGIVRIHYLGRTLENSVAPTHTEPVFPRNGRTSSNGGGTSFRRALEDDERYP
jgi:hypothetical protein